jgi:hypothetical protein
MLSPAHRVPLVEIRYMEFPVVKAVWKRQSYKEYETNHSAYRPVIIYNRKQGHYIKSDRRICEMMTITLQHQLFCQYM